ncbi:hypothetical protein GOBAR_AA17750 [Gossypium barbadense]|uniref:RRM domain-containing protein n=1 Tax=Gossypium barbadense TaxID=3634 RepID=A0A2P5XHY7_GOSBA|nr:hypothetical protein GOBAR_AA17750 [Gossypium barbadense]
MAYPHYRSPFGDTTFTKVFVGGLAWETPTEEMRRYFQQFGEILEAVIITEKNTGKSKGYGFVSVPDSARRACVDPKRMITFVKVTFRDPESARRACVDPNPVIGGRRANCNIASLGRPRPSPPRGRNQGSSPFQGVAQQGSQLTVLNTGITKLSIIHKSSRHNTIINCMVHHQLQWGLHIILATLCKLPGEHFLHPRLNASPDRPIFTILHKWRGPSPPILPPLFIPLGIHFHLLQNAPEPNAHMVLVFILGKSQTPQPTSTESEPGAITSESPKT